jgi:cysteine-rich repeat protein
VCGDFTVPICGWPHQPLLRPRGIRFPAVGPSSATQTARCRRADNRGNVPAGEQCDDGNLVDTDACRNTCQFPRCGDGIASASETCDTNGNSQTCNLDCSAPACGDGKLNPAFTPAGAPGPEQCDDTNTTSGDGCSNRCQVEPFALVVTKAGTGTGTVTSAPAGISCGADCNELYPVGTMVTLTAAPGTNSVFTGWAGGGCTGTAPCAVTMSAARNVVATFDLNTLTVVKAGTGTGTVTATATSIGGDCT